MNYSKVPIKVIKQKNRMLMKNLPRESKYINDLFNEAKNRGLMFLESPKDETTNSNIFLREKS